MEKHKCKVCLKNFTNGRFLGGHMTRSHMMNLYIQQKTEQKHQISEETDPILLCSSSSEGEETEEKEMLKKSLRIVDLQDRESETESSQNPTQYRRSKQIKKSRISYTHYMSNYDYRHVPYAESSAYVSARVSSSEPVSTIWDTSPEEDVAYCLMMLSRDKWRKKEIEIVDYYEDDEQEEEKDQKQYKVTK
uniref:Zinc finger protein ZAT4-like n=1 Tax=Nicotiana tabacum TaxID=4097 RepID=A0A1S3YTY1_TOBAC|nr:PREDICTED: zinc finger protein ZAT4-like [Nicotiana tabacum]